jgi:predicted lipid-binding transport protein (Tim44 family)
LFLIPTDRLRQAGWPARALGTYLGSMLLLGVVTAELPGPARFLVPILIVGYLAPFVAARSGIERRRRAAASTVTVERPPIKQVSGPARDVPREPAAAPAARPEAKASAGPAPEAPASAAPGPRADGPPD